MVCRDEKYTGFFRGKALRNDGSCNTKKSVEYSQIDKKALLKTGVFFFDDDSKSFKNFKLSYSR